MFFGALESHFTIVTISHVYVCVSASRQNTCALMLLLYPFIPTKGIILCSQTPSSLHVPIHDMPYANYQRRIPSQHKNIHAAGARALQQNGSLCVLLFFLCTTTTTTVYCYSHWLYGAIVFILYVYTCATRMIFYIYDI